jgi:hypothetical protein
VCGIASAYSQLGAPRYVCRELSRPAISCFFDPTSSNVVASAVLCCSFLARPARDSTQQRRPRNSTRVCDRERAGVKEKGRGGSGGVVVRGRETKGEEARRNACNEHRAAPCSRSSVIVSRRVVVFLGFPRALSRCRPFVCSLVRSLVRLFVRTFVYLFVRSCARTFVRYVSVSTLVDTSFAISRVDFSRRVRGGVVYATCCFLAPRFIADTQPC